VGQPSATLVVFYATTIAPDSFRATLGGHDVSARFRPVAGAHEVVTLPVAPGTSALLLSVQATLPDGRTATHTDRFELTRR